ncbi:MAG: polymerase sigma-70 factor, subfamily [Chloroflexota bacterium]|nr:polymerase sigma-70 factor, subfamily [Chloroflexota bacterium]
MDLDTGPFAGAWQQHRGYLINVAYRLLGSVSEAEDMVQEAFARLLRADVDASMDLRGWLVVVVTRLCLDQLRSARARHEVDAGPSFPEPLAHLAGTGPDPADIVTLDESVRMALLIVLERLTPAERVVFVLHDVFDYSFEELAPMVERTPAACRQLASRARRRINTDATTPRTAVDPLEMRRVAERFSAAVAGGQLEPLLMLLDPQVVGWVDVGGAGASLPQPTEGRDQVANQAIRFFRPARGISLSVAEVNGEPGIIATRDGEPVAVIVLATRDGLITAIYSIADPAKLTRVR